MAVQYLQRYMKQSPMPLVVVVNVFAVQRVRRQVSVVGAVVVVVAVQMVVIVLLVVESGAGFPPWLAVEQKQRQPMPNRPPFQHQHDVQRER